MFDLDRWEQLSRSSESRLPELDVPAIRGLFEVAQSGGARRVAHLCRSWCESAAESAYEFRFWLLTLEFFCAQTEELKLDQSAIVAELNDVAVATKLPNAEAAARSSRALWLATQGRHSLGLFDLGRAAVLLTDQPAVLDEGDGLNGPYLRQLACNTLALALMRQGINDQALLWLGRCREIAMSRSDGASGVFLALFNEAWIHLTTGFELDMAERTRDGITCYLRAAETFDAALKNDPQWSASSALAPSAELLSAAALVLAEDNSVVERLRMMLSNSKYVRPDHRAVCLLALSRAASIAGENTDAANFLASAMTGLPQDHSFRSISGRILWEEVVVADADRRRASADEPAHRLLRFLINDQQGERLARLSAYQNWIELEQQRMRLLADEGMALVDSLTGLSNRRALEVSLSDALAAAAVGGEPAALVFIDLDDFKTVNDQMSHHVGDVVLQIFADHVRSLLRPQDVAVRYGGDEFVLLLVGRTASGVHQEMRSLQSALTSSTRSDSRVGRAVSFSAGAVTVKAKQTAEVLLLLADRAMLNAKRSGRNTILFDEQLFS